MVAHAHEDYKMVNKIYLTIGILLIALLSTGVIYITWANNARVRVDDDKTTFYVPRSEGSRVWVVAGREFNNIFDGTTKMNRRTGEITVSEVHDDKGMTITRRTPYIRGPVVIDTYKFASDISDIELFPVSHTVEVLNAKGYNYKYEVRDLTYNGDTYKLSGQTSAEFGRNMKVTWWDDYRLGWVYKSGSMYVKSEKIDSDYVTFDVRLFDPVSPGTNGIVFNSGKNSYPGSWTHTYTITVSPTWPATVGCAVNTIDDIFYQVMSSGYIDSYNLTTGAKLGTSAQIYNSYDSALSIDPTSGMLIASGWSTGNAIVNTDLTINRTNAGTAIKGANCWDLVGGSLYGETICSNAGTAYNYSSDATEGHSMGYSGDYAKASGGNPLYPIDGDSWFLTANEFTGSIRYHNYTGLGSSPELESTGILPGTVSVCPINRTAFMKGGPTNFAVYEYVEVADDYNTSSITFETDYSPAGDSRNIGELTGCSNDSSDYHHMRNSPYTVTSNINLNTGTKLTGASTMFVENLIASNGTRNFFPKFSMQDDDGDDGGWQRYTGPDWVTEEDKIHSGIDVVRDIYYNFTWTCYTGNETCSGFVSNNSATSPTLTWTTEANWDGLSSFRASGVTGEQFNFTNLIVWSGEIEDYPKAATEYYNTSSLTFKT